MTDRNLQRTMSYSVRGTGNGTDDPFNGPQSPTIQRTTLGPNGSGSKQPVFDPRASFGSESSKISFGNIQVPLLSDLEYYNVDDVPYMRDPDLLRSLADDNNLGKGKDTRIILTVSDEEYDKLVNDPIFEQVCPREQYKDQKECKVCRKAFKLLNGRKHWYP